MDDEPTNMLAGQLNLRKWLNRKESRERSTTIALEQDMNLLISFSLASFSVESENRFILMAVNL